MPSTQPSRERHLASFRITATDAGEKSRPERLHMGDREEMKGVYSQFVYQKAGAVLLMVEDCWASSRFVKACKSI